MNLNNHFQTNYFLSFLTVTVLVCFSTVSFAEPFSMPLPRDAAQIVTFREAGAQGKRQLIPKLVAVLQQRPEVHQDVSLTAIHSLAQLGATEALPAIDTFAAARQDSSIKNYVKVAEARLMAEKSAANVKQTRQKTEYKIAAFCQYLDLSADTVNAAAADYAKNQGPWQHPLVPVEVYAMREIADILYESHVSDYQSIPVIGRLDFSTDYPSSLKMKMLGLSRQERIDWLINDLAHKKALHPEDDYDLQLAHDEGNEAGQAALVKLSEMARHREEYSAAGFDALFGIVDGTDLDPQSRFRSSFKDDPDPKLSSIAQIGGAGDGVAGY